MLGKGWAPKFLFCKHLPLHHKQRASSLGLSLSATVLDFHRLLSLVSLPSAMWVVGFLSGEPTTVSLESWSGESDCRMLSTPRPMCKSGRGMERLVYWLVFLIHSPRNLLSDSTNKSNAEPVFPTTCFSSRVVYLTSLSYLHKKSESDPRACPLPNSVCGEAACTWWIRARLLSKTNQKLNPGSAVYRLYTINLSLLKYNKL